MKKEWIIILIVIGVAILFLIVGLLFGQSQRGNVENAIRSSNIVTLKLTQCLLNCPYIKQENFTTVEPNCSKACSDSLKGDISNLPKNVKITEEQTNKLIIYELFPCITQKRNESEQVIKSCLNDILERNKDLIDLTNNA